MGSNKNVKSRMIKIYGNHCWMNELWIPSQKDILTFHHIMEKRYGGRALVSNGALLALSSHTFLNYLDEMYPIVYRDLNNLFLELNRTMSPPDSSYYDEVHLVLSKCPRHFPRTML